MDIGQYDTPKICSTTTKHRSTVYSLFFAASSEFFLLLTFCLFHNSSPTADRSARGPVVAVKNAVLLAVLRPVVLIRKHDRRD